MKYFRSPARPALGIAIGAAAAASFAATDPALAATVELGDPDLIAVKIGAAAIAVWYVAAHLRLR